MKIPAAAFDHEGRQILERDDTEEEVKLRRRLIPAKGLHRSVPRVCGTCTYGRVIDGSFDCLRENGFSTDVGDMEHWYHVCDGYKQET